MAAVSSGKAAADPACAVQHEHRLLSIGEPQALDEARHILFDEDGKRREPERGTGRQAKRRLDRDQPGEAAKLRHAAEQSGEEAIIVERLDGAHRTRRNQERRSSPPTRSAESCSSPPRSLTDAVSPSGSIAPLP